MAAVTSAALGIDIAKRTFHACLRLPSGKYRSRQFDNQLSGFHALLAWLAKHQGAAVHACMEATGTYGEALALFLYEQGHPVSVVNPLQIVRYAQSQSTRAKTDQVDAQVIADFCAKEEPVRWSPPEPVYRYLQALLRHRETLLETRQRERNRLGAADHPPFIRAAFEAHLAHLDAALQAVDAEIRTHLAAHPELRAEHQRLCTIPGIGALTASWLLGELGGGRRFRSAREVAAYVGLEPRLRQSGPWKGQTRLSKRGNVWLRKALYFPALAALRFNPVVQQLATRLRERGKVPMAVVGAAMRKLLHLAFGVLRQGQDFDPAWAS